MAALPDHTPDVVKFTTFLRNVAQIPTGALPDAAPVIQHAFDAALDMVNLDLGIAVAQATSWSPYELAVYNLATHYLVEYAADQSYPLSALTWQAGIATATTVTPHGLLPGDQVRIVGVSPLAYAGPAPAAGVTITDVIDNVHIGYHLARNPGQAVLLSGAAAQALYFACARRAFRLSSFVPGVVGSTSDLSTSVGLDNPDFFRNLTLDQLQLLKTPWGRNYLAIAQKYGPGVWGLTL